MPVRNASTHLYQFKSVKKDFIMERKEFDPNEWINKDDRKQAVKLCDNSRSNKGDSSVCNYAVHDVGSKTGSGVDSVTRSIEESKGDITGRYGERRNIVGTANEKGVAEVKDVPTMPARILEGLPEFLKKVVAHAASDEERDILLLGSMAALSSALPSFYGIYDGKKVFSNLYLFVTAQASAGKGRLVHCKQLVLPIHMHLRQQAKLLKSEYDLLLMEYNQKDKEEGGEKPSRPAEKMLLIPANNSTTGVFQLLHDNDGRGMIFETEGDTLAQAFKSDYGNYSDGFRKAFHHETISYYRRTDREYVDIESPCVSTVLSGTPKQVAALIPNAENGLFSRFIFYFMNVQPVWKNVFALSGDESLDAYFGKLGMEFFKLYQLLEDQEGIEFQLSAEQKAQFNQFFEQVQGVYVCLKGLDYLATVRRLGLIAFRMCMVLTALRIMEHGGVQKQMICEDKDFEIVLDMIRVLVKHASKVYSELPEEEQLPKRKQRQERFYEALPQEFNRKAYQEVARMQGIPDKTAQRYIGELCKSGVLHHDGHDRYENVLFEEVRK